MDGPFGAPPWPPSERARVRSLKTSHADAEVGFSPHSCRYLAKAAKAPPRKLRETRELLPPGRRAARTSSWCDESPAKTAPISRLPWRSSAFDEAERTTDERALHSGGFGNTWSSLGVDYGLATPRGSSAAPSARRRATSISSAGGGASREVALLREENERLRARLGALERRLASPSGGARALDEAVRFEQRDHPLARPRTVAMISSGGRRHPP